MYLEKTKKAFFKMMNDRLHQEGWETVRRAFTDCGHKKLSADTLAIILGYYPSIPKLFTAGDSPNPKDIYR